MIIMVGVLIFLGTVTVVVVDDVGGGVGAASEGAEMKAEEN